MKILENQKMKILKIEYIENQDQAETELGASWSAGAWSDNCRRIKKVLLFTKNICQEKSSLHGLGIMAIVCIDYNEEQFACECINLPDKRPPTHLLQLCKLIKEQKSDSF